MTDPKPALYDASGKPTHWRHAGRLFTEHVDRPEAGEAPEIDPHAPHVETRDLSLVAKPKPQALIVPTGTRPGPAVLNDGELDLLEQLRSISQRGQALGADGAAEAQRLYEEILAALPEQIDSLRTLRRLGSGLFRQAELVVEKHSVRYLIDGHSVRYLIDGLRSHPVL